MRIAAPPEKVFLAFTDDYDAWWPHRYKADSKCSVDARPGGYIYEHFSNGGGAVTGTIVYLDFPHKFIASGPSSLSRGASAYNVQTLEEDGEGGTIFKRTMEIWGSVPEEMEKMFTEGSRRLMEMALQGYLEKGIVYDVTA